MRLYFLGAVSVCLPSLHASMTLARPWHMRTNARRGIPFSKHHGALCTLGLSPALLGAAVQRCHGPRVPSRFLGLVCHAKPGPGTRFSFAYFFVRCRRVTSASDDHRWVAAADFLSCTVNQFSRGLTRPARGYGGAALWPSLEAPYYEQVMSISLYRQHTAAFLSLETSCDVQSMQCARSRLRKLKLRSL